MTPADVAIDRNRKAKAKRIAQALLADYVEILRAAEPEAWEKVGRRLNEDIPSLETQKMIIDMIDGITRQ